MIVELDGGSHMTERRFHDDRARDRANLAQGDWRTVRVTSRHLDHERRELAADLSALLARPVQR
jgi:very-short-patch-repair endonuclease